MDHLRDARFVGLDIPLDRPSADTEGDSLLIEALRRHGRVIAGLRARAATTDPPLPPELLLIDCSGPPSQV